VSRVDAAGLLFVCAEDGTGLCVRRGASGSEPNAWTPPGGLREGQETMRQAAEREAREELGLHAWPGTNRPLGYLVDENGFVTFVDAVTPRWKKKFARHDFNSSEVAEVAWLPLDTLPENAHPGFRRVHAQPIRKLGEEFDVGGRPNGPGIGDAPDISDNRAEHMSGQNPGIILRDLGPWAGLNIMSPKVEP